MSIETMESILSQGPAIGELPQAKVKQAFANIVGEVAISVSDTTIPANRIKVFSEVLRFATRRPNTVVSDPFNGSPWPETFDPSMGAFDRFNDIEPVAILAAIRDSLAGRRAPLGTDRPTAAHSAIESVLEVTGRVHRPAVLGFSDDVWGKLFSNPAYTAARHAYAENPTPETKKTRTLTALWVISSMNNGIENPSAPRPTSKLGEYDIS